MFKTCNAKYSIKNIIFKWQYIIKIGKNIGLIFRHYIQISTFFA